MFNRIPAAVGAALVGVLAALSVPTGAQAFPNGAEVVRKSDNDRVRFVSAPRGRPMPRPSAHSPAADPRDVGRAFLQDHAADFGLRGSTLSAIRRSDDVRGGAAVRYLQRIDGVKVLGGQFVVRLDRENRILTAQGEAEPNTSVDTEAALASGEAERRAIAAVARHEGVHGARLETTGTELTIYNDRLIGGPGPDRAQLVWATHVSDGMTIKKLVLVDADTGVILGTIEEAPDAKQRSVCDAENASVQLPCTDPVVTEGQTYGGAVADVTPAYVYSGAFYDFLLGKFGRDSLDDNGIPLKSTVRYCDPAAACPYQNAMWNGEQMIYGEGYAIADDVVGHELAHGYTEFTSGLLYYFQSGAINESMSDVFGELLDIDTASPDDTVNDAWKMGETIPGGALRDMKDPAAFGHPDRMQSLNYWLDENLQDAGGVHVNSGVGNKAAYLLVDGGTFNGRTVTALGKEKVAQIYNKVQTSFLTSGSDYVDLGLALVGACEGLVGTGGITAADCVEVRDAVAATEMLLDRPEAPDAAECATGYPVYGYSQSFEGDLPDWDSTTFDNAPAWALIGDYAASGRIALHTPNRDGTASTHAAYMTESVTVPADASLSFQTAWDFEAPNYDGAVVEVSTDGGSNWSPLSLAAYNGAIAASDGNPLAARPAFVGRSGGYRRVVTSLASLGGQQARFRFVYGHDIAVKEGFGWVIDDVRILTCAAQAAPAVLLTQASGLTQTGARLHGTVNPNGESTSYKFEYGPQGTFAQSTSQTNLAGGASAVPVQVAVTGLAAGTTYSYRLVAANGTGETRSSPSTFTTQAAPDGSAPVVTTLAATNVLADSARLNGSIDPNGVATSVLFEVGSASDLSDGEPIGNPISAGSGTSPLAFFMDVGWNPLAVPPGTKIFYRAVALRGSTRFAGAIVSFTTPQGTGGVITRPPTTPVISPTPVTPVTPVPANVSGTAKPVKRRVKSAKVACDNSGGKVACTVTFAGAKRKRKVSVTLKSGAVTVAKGATKRANARGEVGIRGARSLTPGAYTMTIKVGRRKYAFKLTLK